MVENDDFEIINEYGLLDEQTFEFVDTDNSIAKQMVSTKPTTPNIISSTVSASLVNKIPEVVQQQEELATPPESKLLSSTNETITSIAPTIQVKETISPPQVKKFAPVPYLPKAPDPKRYGNAALIPHNTNELEDLEAIINISKKTHQDTLNICTQQQIDIQKALEQRRNLSLRK